MKARIAGHEALFIFDSGASVNVLADWYANVAKIPTTTAAGTATGSGGKTAAVRTAHRLRGHWSAKGLLGMDAMRSCLPS